MKLTRRSALAALASAVADSARARTVPGALPPMQAALERGEWPVYAGSNGAQRYSPLDLIDKHNAGRLKVLWRWRSPDHDLRDQGVKASTAFTHESTPIMVG